jgi:hypothetical protein
MLAQLSPYSGCVASMNATDPWARARAAGRSPPVCLGPAASATRSATIAARTSPGVDLLTRRLPAAVDLAGHAEMRAWRYWRAVTCTTRCPEFRICSSAPGEDLAAHPWGRRWRVRKIGTLRLVPPPALHIACTLTSNEFTKDCRRMRREAIIRSTDRAKSTERSAEPLSPTVEGHRMAYLNALVSRTLPRKEKIPSNVAGSDGCESA